MSLNRPVIRTVLRNNIRSTRSVPCLVGLPLLSQAHCNLSIRNNKQFESINHIESPLQSFYQKIIQKKKEGKNKLLFSAIIVFEWVFYYYFCISLNELIRHIFDFQWMSTLMLRIWWFDHCVSIDHFCSYACVALALMTVYILSGASPYDEISLIFMLSVFESSKMDLLCAPFFGYYFCEFGKSW